MGLVGIFAASDIANGLLITMLVLLGLTILLLAVATVGSIVHYSKRRRGATAAEGDSENPWIAGFRAVLEALAKPIATLTSSAAWFRKAAAFGTITLILTLLAGAGAVAVAIGDDDNGEDDDSTSTTAADTAAP